MNDKIRPSEMVAAARFEMRINDPSEPGAMVWVGCEVTSAEPEVSLAGVECWRVLVDTGLRTQVDTESLRRVRQ